jgi:3-deoxy-D-manno-octulosonate 8-phosphate phosphatase (KDO 8-P phosphatase)
MERSPMELVPGKPKSLMERCRAVRWLIVDVDGVLTDGRICYAAAAGATTTEIKAFHVRDGSGLKLWHLAGFRSAIITGRSSPIVTHRAGELGVSRVFQGASDKMPALKELLRENEIDSSAICYVGDDEPDVPLLERVGLAVAVADACPSARAAAHYVTVASGGRGAVREAIERILRCQGKMS